jgi:hypothetical protein
VPPRFVGTAERGNVEKLYVFMLVAPCTIMGEPPSSEYLYAPTPVSCTASQLLLALLEFVAQSVQGCIQDG